MAKKDYISITGFDLYKGMQDSPFLGVSDVRNLDITSVPGIAKIAPKMTKESGNTVDDLIRNWDMDPNTGTVWAVDDSGQAYSRVAGAWSTVSGYTGSSVKGAKVYKDYFIVAGNSGSNTVIQRYGPLSGSPAWSSAVINTGSTTDGNVPMLIDSADILYMGTNERIASLTTPTGTPTEGVLVIPTKFSIVSLEQLGTRVYAGTTQSNGATVSYLFPWDRVNINPDIPVPVSGSGIRQAKAIGNLLYTHSGLHGSINVTNGSAVQEIKRIVTWNATPLDSLDVNPSAIDVMNGGLLIGVGKTATADDQSPVGVFYYKDKGEKIKSWSYLIPSHGLDGSAGQVCKVGAVLSLGDTSFIASWYDGTNYGVDVFDTSRCYQNYSAWFTSPLYQLNQVLDKTALARIEFRFAKPLEIGQGLKVEYRESAYGAWTALGTWDFATKGATREGFFPFGYSKPELQVRVSLTTGSSNALTPEFLSLTLI